MLASSQREPRASTEISLKGNVGGLASAKSIIRILIDLDHLTTLYITEKEGHNLKQPPNIRKSTQNILQNLISPQKLQLHDKTLGGIRIGNY
jgi:hypothetical protein